MEAPNKKSKNQKRKTPPAKEEKAAKKSHTQKNSQEQAPKEPEIEQETQPESSEQAHQQPAEQETKNENNEVPQEEVPQEEETKDEEEEETKEEGGDEEDGELIDVDFEFYDPRPDDFWSIERFLKDFLENNPFNATQMAQLVANQVSVGTTIKCSADEYPLSFISALNMHQHKDTECMKQCREYITKRCKDESTKQALRDLLQDSSKPLGLILHDRLINMPIELVPMLHQALVDDIDWAVQNEETEEEKNSFKFENFLVITRIYQPESGKKKKSKKQNETEEMIFFKFEDEFYYKHATLTFTFPVSHTLSSSAYSDLPQTRVVMVVPASKMHKIVSQINKAVEAAQ